MERHIEIDLIGSWAYKVDVSGKVKDVIRLPIRYTTIKKMLKYRNPLLHPTWFGRRKIFHDLKGYKDFLKVSQDYEFLIRAILKNDTDILTGEFYSKYIQKRLFQKEKIEKARKHILEFLNGNPISFFRAFLIYPSLTFNFLYKALASKMLETYEYIVRNEHDISKR